MNTMISLFEKAYGDYNSVLKKILIEKIIEHGYDNQYDIKSLTSLVFEYYQSTWGKPPDWAAINQIIAKNGMPMPKCPACNQYLSQQNKKSGGCSFCEKQKQRLLEAELSPEENNRVLEYLQDFIKKTQGIDKK